MKSLRFLPAAIFLALCGLMLFGMLQSPEMQNFMASTDRALPAFDLPTLESKTTRFTPASLSNQVSLVHFFATWCGICMREQPRMIALSQDLNIPLYTVMWRSDPASVAKWQKDTEPYAHVAIDNTGQAGMEFGIMGVPHTFLIDKKGHIRYSYVGNISEKELNSRLLPLIRQYQDEK